MLAVSQREPQNSSIIMPVNPANGRRELLSNRGEFNSPEQELVHQIITGTKFYSQFNRQQIIDNECWRHPEMSRRDISLIAHTYFETRQHEIEDLLFMNEKLESMRNILTNLIGENRRTIRKLTNNL
jgi:hypothetical protein